MRKPEGLFRNEVTKPQVIHLYYGLWVCFNVNQPLHYTFPTKMLNFFSPQKTTEKWQLTNLRHELTYCGRYERTKTQPYQHVHHVVAIRTSHQWQKQVTPDSGYTNDKCWAKRVNPNWKHKDIFRDYNIQMKAQLTCSSAEYFLFMTVCQPITLQV